MPDEREDAPVRADLDTGHSSQAQAVFQSSSLRAPPARLRTTLTSLAVFHM